MGPGLGTLLIRLTLSGQGKGLPRPTFSFEAKMHGRRDFNRELTPPPTGGGGPRSQENHYDGKKAILNDHRGVQLPAGKKAGSRTSQGWFDLSVGTFGDRSVRDICGGKKMLEGSFSLTPPVSIFQNMELNLHMPFYRAVSE